MDLTLSRANDLRVAPAPELGRGEFARHDDSRDAALMGMARRKKHHGPSRGWSARCPSDLRAHLDFTPLLQVLWPAQF